MAYLDQRGIARSPAALIAVAALEAALIYAVVSGLATRIFQPKEPARTEGFDIPLPPPPPTPTPSASPSDSLLNNDRTRHPIPLPQPTTAPSPAPTGKSEPYTPPSPTPSPSAAPQPTPSPAPGFTPRSAKPLGKPGAWVTNADYPTRDINDGNQGLVRFSLSIGADGRVKGCTITGSSGHPGLDKAACALIARRARFEPATDATGARVAGTYAGSVRWVIPN